MSTGRMKIVTAVFALFLVLILVIWGCGKGEEPADQKPASQAKTAVTPAQGDWTILFDGSNFDQWNLGKPDAWKIEDGAMTKGAGGYIWTKKRYGDFILDCDFKISEGGNSGIFFRTDDINDAVQTGIEMQVYNIERQPKPVKNDCGAIYDFLEPSSYADKPAGEWNHVVITCNDNIITVVMNGVQIIDMDVNNWTEPHKNPDGSENKFNTALKDFARDGYIGFQDHGDQVWYRNVKIKEL